MHLSIQQNAAAPAPPHPCYTRFMIASLNGSIIDRRERSLVIECHGVGYEVFVPQHILGSFAGSEEAIVWAYHHIKEDQSKLYGFDTRAAQAMFELLIGISGVGPRLALGIFDTAPLSSLVNALHSGDASFFQQLPGIGKKTSEKIILELRDKIEKNELLKNISQSNHLGGNAQHDLIEALHSLGFIDRQIHEILTNMPDDITEITDQITWALKNKNTS